MNQKQSNRRAPHRTFAELMSIVEGRWVECIGTLAPQLVENYTYSSSANDAKRHYTCPVHGGVDGFRFYRDFPQKGGAICNTCGGKPNGVVLLAWFFNISTKEATKMVGEWVDDKFSGSTPAPARIAPVIEQPKTYDDEKRAITYTLEGCSPIHGTAAELYLRRERKLPEYAIAYRRLRFHPGVKYYHKLEKEKSKYYGTFAALIALYRAHADNNNVRTLHKVHLASDGKKAAVPEVKKSMNVVGTMNGGAVPLFDPEYGVLALTEGMETGMSVRAGTYLPFYATLTAGNLETLDLVKGVELYIIFADKDKTERGYIAAYKFAKKVLEAGKKALVFFPQLDIPKGEKGIDWSDVWLQQGSAGFPADWRYNRRTEECSWLTDAKDGVDIPRTYATEESQAALRHEVEVGLPAAIERQRAIAAERRLALEAQRKAEREQEAKNEEPSEVH